MCFPAVEEARFGAGITRRTRGGVNLRGAGVTGVAAVMRPACLPTRKQAGAFTPHLAAAAAAATARSLNDNRRRLTRQRCGRDGARGFVGDHHRTGRGRCQEGSRIGPRQARRRYNQERGIHETYPPLMLTRRESTASGRGAFSSEPGGPRASLILQRIFNRRGQTLVRRVRSHRLLPSFIGFRTLPP